MAGHRAERREKGPSHLTPAHSTQQLLALAVLLLLTSTISAATRFSKWHCKPKPSLQASCSLLLQKLSAAFSSLLSQQGQFEVAQHLQPDRKKPSFCHQKAVREFPASYLQAHAHWTLICPHSLCGSSNASPTRHWPATGTCFFEIPFCEDGRGLCCSLPCIHYWHISEITQNGKHLDWEQPKAVLQDLLKKRDKSGT